MVDARAHLRLLCLCVLGALPPSLPRPMRAMDLDMMQLWVQTHDRSVVLLHHGACEVCDDFTPELESIAREINATVAFDVRNLTKPHVFAHGRLAFARVDITVGWLGARRKVSTKLQMARARGRVEKEAFFVAPEKSPRLKVFYRGAALGQRVVEYDGLLQHDKVLAWCEEVLAGEEQAWAWPDESKWEVIDHEYEGSPEHEAPRPYPDPARKEYDPEFVAKMEANARAFRAAAHDWRADDELTVPLSVQADPKGGPHREPYPTPDGNARAASCDRRDP